MYYFVKQGYNRYTKRKGEIDMYTGIFCFGAGVYTIMELLYRGYTHWTMTLAGGLCLLLLYCTFMKMKKCSLALKSLAGAAIITAVEFAVGCMVNLYLKWNIWDYSDMQINILGQVCLYYTCIWFLVSAAAAVLLNAAEKLLK